MKWLHTTGTWCVLGLLVALWLPAGSAWGQGYAGPSFDELSLLVSEFQNGLRPDIVNGQCTTSDPTEVNPRTPFEPVDELVCLEGNSPIIGSGWDIAQACVVVFDTGLMNVGFRQSGVAGDGDGDGNPNSPGSFQTDLDGVGRDESYEVALDSDFVGSAEFVFKVSSVNVGDHNVSGLGTPEGQLCIVVLPSFSSAPVAGPVDLGCVDGAAADLFGSYSAGTTGAKQEAPPGGPLVSKDVLFRIDDIATLPFGRSLNPAKLVVTLKAGSLADSCVEDTTIFRLIEPCSLTIEKNAAGVCRNNQVTFSADYSIRNNGGEVCAGVELEDIARTVPPDLLGDVSCTADGVPVPTEPLPGGSFRVLLPALPASDLDVAAGGPFPSSDDIDCNGDGVFDTSCGLTVVHCRWDPISASIADPIEFANDATVFEATPSGRRAHGTASAAATVFTPCPDPIHPMRKEHEGVGFDNMLELTPTLPGDAFGSNVNPAGGADVDPGEDFEANGALAVLGQPGVYANVPRMPGGNGLRPQRGSLSVFNWQMLITGDVDDFHSLDVTCALCSEKTGRTDGSPAQTFVPSLLPQAGNDFMIADQAVMMTLSHVCGPIHGAGPCGGSMSAVTTPGLKRRDSSVMGPNFVTFLGCKPTTVQFDPLSSGDLLLPGDFLDVQITVPQNERSSIRADVTSCEAAYLTNTPPRP